MNIVVEIKSLLARRLDHVVAIQEIDRQLSELRDILGSTTDTPDALPSPRNRIMRGHRVPRALPGQLNATQQQIIDALAVTEPQTVKMIESRVETQTCGFNLKDLVTAGYVVRRSWKLTDTPYRGKLVYWYARTVAPLDALERQLIESHQIEQDEGALDPSIPPTDTVVGGILSATGTNGSGPSISAPGANCVPARTTTGDE
jgi:hypothetical protein